MALSPNNRDGGVSKIGAWVLEASRDCAGIYGRWGLTKIVVSNGYLYKGVVLFEKEREYLARNLLISDNIICPGVGEKVSRNTYEELRFAREYLKKLSGQKKLLIVANVIHMPRVLETAHVVFHGVDDVELFWMSCHDYCSYGLGVVQWRFWHPLFFLGYECLVRPYSHFVKRWS